MRKVRAGTKPDYRFWRIVALLLAVSSLTISGSNVTFAQNKTHCDLLWQNTLVSEDRRMEAARECVEKLPSLSPDEQVSIIRNYVTRLPQSIDPSQYEDLASKLVPDAALPLKAYAARYYSHMPGAETGKRLDDLMAQANFRNDDLSKAHIYFARAIRVFRLGGDHAVMESYLQQALGLALEGKMSGLLPFIYNALAIRAKVDGEYDVAIEQYQKSLAVFEANGDFAGTGIIYANIGNIFSDLGDNIQAIKLYRQAIAIYKKYSPENVDRLIAVYTNLGTALSLEEQFDAAITAFDEARRYSKDSDSSRMNGLINYQNAVALHGSGQSETAILMAERSIDQILQNRDPSEAANALNWLAARYIESKQFTQAQGALGRARQIMEPDGSGTDGLLENPGNTFWAQEYAESMGALFIALGRPVDATPYLDVALQLSNSRFDQEKVKAIANSQLLFELRDREARLSTMQDQALIADLKLEQSRLQTILIFAIAISIGLVTYFLYRSYLSQKRLAASKDTFLSEIHHRTKNNLQILTSLLNMDIRRSQSGSPATGSRRDAANRARTMALVHDHIYNHGKPSSTKIDVKPFLENLLELLSESLGNADVALHWDIVSAKVDVDRLTPLGLLVCELITNAYKHAFDDRGGKIEVSLVGKPGTLELVVKDNGAGFDQKEAERNTESVGLLLLEDLADQIDGKLTVQTNSNGTIWTLAPQKSNDLLTIAHR